MVDNKHQQTYLSPPTNYIGCWMQLMIVKSYLVPKWLNKPPWLLKKDLPVRPPFLLLAELGWTRNRPETTGLHQRLNLTIIKQQKKTSCCVASVHHGFWKKTACINTQVNSPTEGAGYLSWNMCLIHRQSLTPGNTHFS